jgi:hypothetical protein
VAAGGDEGVWLLRLVTAFDESAATMVEAHARPPRTKPVNWGSK